MGGRRILSAPVVVSGAATLVLGALWLAATCWLPGLTIPDHRACAKVSWVEFVVLVIPLGFVVAAVLLSAR